VYPVEVFRSGVAEVGDYFRTLATPQRNVAANDGIAAPGPMIDIGFGDERPPPSAGPIVKSHAVNDHVEVTFSERLADG
jgi:hypothetical protein